MARSTYVYVVLEDGSPVAGFTVKHELKTWLSRQQPFSRRRVYRIPDNGFSGRNVVEMTEAL